MQDLQVPPGRTHDTQPKLKVPLCCNSWMVESQTVLYATLPLHQVEHKHIGFYGNNKSRSQLMFNCQYQPGITSNYEPNYSQFTLQKEHGLRSGITPPLHTVHL